MVHMAKALISSITNPSAQNAAKGRSNPRLAHLGGHLLDVRPVLGFDAPQHRQLSALNIHLEQLHGAAGAA
jgi:hypothetical protein